MALLFKTVLSTLAEKHMQHKNIKNTVTVYLLKKPCQRFLSIYAVEKNIVSANISRSVHGISSKKFSEPNKKEATEQVYIDDEIQLILEAIVLFPIQKPLQENVNCICRSVQRNISK